jgi:site-specific recombinase XerC
MADVAPSAVHPLITEYLVTLSGKAEATVEAYRRALRDFVTWIAARPSNGGQFLPEHLTRTALDVYLAHLASIGASISHRARVKAAVSGFARWLIDDKGLLRRNPAHGIGLPPQPLLAPRQLTPDQRYVLRSLVERDGSARSEAIFALGYWAGCRVSDVAWLRLEHAHIGPKVGWVEVGYKGVVRSMS